MDIFQFKCNKKNIIFKISHFYISFNDYKRFSYYIYLLFKSDKLPDFYLYDKTKGYIDIHSNICLDNNFRCFENLKYSCIIFHKNKIRIIFNKRYDYSYLDIKMDNEIDGQLICIDENNDMKKSHKLYNDENYDLVIKKLKRSAVINKLLE